MMGKLRDIWDEWAGIIVMVIVIGGMILLVGGIGAGMYLSGSNFNAAVSDAKDDLLIQGYHVVDGEINSPTAIEITRDYAAFVSAVPDGLVIYEASIDSWRTSFVAVFNSTYGLAYIPEYQNVSWWFW